MSDFEKDIVDSIPMLKQYAFTLTKNKEYANDLLQDTLLRAFLKEDLFTKNTNLGGWLSTMMKNLFISQLKVKSRFISKDNIDFEEIYKVTNKKFDCNDGVSNLGIEVINSLFKDINKTNLEMFLLMEKGFKYKELAEIFNIPIGSVKGQLHYTKKELKNKLKKLGYENSKT